MALGKTTVVHKTKCKNKITRFLKSIEAVWQLGIHPFTSSENLDPGDLTEGPGKSLSN